MAGFPAAAAALSPPLVVLACSEFKRVGQNKWPWVAKFQFQLSELQPIDSKFVSKDIFLKLLVKFRGGWNWGAFMTAPIYIEGASLI